MSLAEFQETFAQALATIETPRENMLRDMPELTGIKNLSDKFALCRNQMHKTLASRLETVFPTVKSIVGNEFFTKLTAAYSRANKLIGPEAPEFSEGLPDFIDEFEPALSFPYLPDIGMLDLGYWKSLNALDHQSIQPNLFTELTPELLAKCRISLHPACYWFSSQYAIYHIWKLYHSSQPPQHIDHRVPQDVIIIRPQYKVEVHEIDTGFIKVLDTLDNSGTLQEAFDEGSAWDANFNTVTAIQFLVQNGLIAKLS